MFLKIRASGYKCLLLQNKSDGVEATTKGTAVTCPPRDPFWFVSMHPIVTIQSFLSMWHAILS